jgi:hypothetical protein
MRISNTEALDEIIDHPDWWQFSLAANWYIAHPVFGSPLIVFGEDVYYRRKQLGLVDEDSFSRARRVAIHESEH